MKRSSTTRHWRGCTLDIHNVHISFRQGHFIEVNKHFYVLSFYYNHWDLSNVNGKRVKAMITYLQDAVDEMAI